MFGLWVIRPCFQTYLLCFQIGHVYVENMGKIAYFRKYFQDSFSVDLLK